MINLLFEWLGEAPANRRLADYVVDGRKVVIAHGTRDMPIWGDRYTPNLNRAISPNASEMFVNPAYDPETVVRMRILAVIDYLNRIQEK